MEPVRSTEISDSTKPSSTNSDANVDTNPYTAPRLSSDEARRPSLIPIPAVVGMFVAGILGAFYLVVFGASIYEVFRAPANWSIASYVREGTLSAIFVVICAVTIRQFRLRRRNARIWILVCPLLLLIFVYPGTHTVFTFFQNMIGL